MNEIVKKFLLAGDKFMPKMLLHILRGTIYKKQTKNKKI